ncbi:MFS transporter [soil metagenome]
MTPGAVSDRVGLYFGLMQLFFGLSWVIYVVYLPQLAAEAGIGAGAVSWILLMDQVIFVLCDWAAGVASDRAAGIIGRLGTFVAGITAISALAFLLLPLVAGVGPSLFLVLTVSWAVTSSALRAPAMTLLGRYTPADRQPRVSALFLLGVGASSTVAPFLGDWLTEYDPRIMFALSAIAVVAVTASIVWAEKTLARSAPVAKPSGPGIRLPRFLGFLAAVLLLATAFQVHAFINSESLFGKLAQPAALPYLLSLFWIGFSTLMVPASALTKRFGGVTVMAAGALIAAASACVSVLATDVVVLSVAQFLCGGAWGAVTMSASAAALRLGHPGSEGKTVGAMYSVMAVAAVGRIAVVAADFENLSVPTLSWLPVIAWSVAGLVLMAAARQSAEPA